MSRVYVPVLLLALAGCHFHHGGPNTPSGNDLILGRLGAPTFARQVQHCPSQNGEGKIVLSFRNGQKRVRGKCHGGVMIGYWKAWYTNGAVIWEANFSHGFLDGEFESWHANDKKMAKVSFKQGLPEGKFKSWWWNGRKRATGKYLDGRKAGCWKTWYKNGQKASEGAYADDHKVGTWIYWTASGQKSKNKLGGDITEGKCGWL